MNPSPNDKVLEYLEVLASFKGTKRTGMEGYHDYYEQAGYAGERIREMGALAVDGLILGLESENPEIRHKAILLLGQIRDRRAVEPLRALLKTESNSRNRSDIQKLLRQLSGRSTFSPHKTVGNPITTQALDVQDRIKKLTQWSKEPESLPLMLEALHNDKANKVRSEAATSIGLSQMRNPEIIPHLMEAMQTDPAPQVRAEAIMGLAYHKTNHEQISEAVLERIESETDTRIYDAILHALKKHPTAKAIPFAMDSITNPKLSLRVVELLKAYVRRGIVTKGMMTPAMEWMEGLLASAGKLNKEQTVAVRELEEILASFETSG